MTARVRVPADEQVQEILSSFPPDQQDVINAKLARVITRQKAIRRFPTPGHLAQFWHEDFIQTPMLDMIDSALMEVEAGTENRWIINVAPQRGKTTRLQAGMAWMLLRDPTLHIVFASYEQSIASQSAHAIRELIETYGSGYTGQKPDPFREDVLGLMLDPTRARNDRWSLGEVPGRNGVTPGGVAATGVGGSLTGRRADIVIIDDPVKNSEQADSEVYRRKVVNWYQHVVLTRLSKRGAVIVLQTRWHEKDLTGWLLSEDEDSLWRHINIPAQAESNDPCGRKPGEYGPDTRGYTPEDWERIKKEVGSRVWHALYQGNPSPPEGGVFKRRWFDNVFTRTVPPLDLIVTFVDPADNMGDGDEAGIMTGGIARDGTPYLLEDASGHMTVSQWVRRSIYAMCRWGATRLCYEQSLSGLKRSIREEWRSIRIQARELRDAFDGIGWPDEPNTEAVSAVVDALLDKDDSLEREHELFTQLREMWPHVPELLSWPDTGPTVRAVQARDSKTRRAELVSPLYENGRVKHASQMPTYINQMCQWHVGQDSPDRMDSGVHLLRYLTSEGGAADLSRTSPGRVPTRTPGRGGMRRSVSGKL